MNYKSFCMKRNIDYKEIVVNNRVFNKFYEISNPDCQDIINIPDGCVDIEFLWKGEAVSAYVCGSLLSGRMAGIGMYDRCFGVQFNPGVIPECFRKHMTYIVNKRCELKKFINLEELQETLSKELSLKDKADYFINNFKEQVIIETNSITTFITKAIKQEDGYINITELISTTGYSHCYVDRIFKNNMGISVKKYANIVRLQQAIEIIKDNKADEIYERLGYYDQAHFIHEFKRFTSITPSMFIKMNEFSIV